MKRRRETWRWPAEQLRHKMRFSPVRERKQGKKDEKTEGLGRHDAVKLKFTEASECRRGRDGERGKPEDERCSGR